MKGNVIQMNTLHLNSVRLNGIGKVQSVSLKGGSTEDPVFPPVEPPVEPEPTPTYTLSASVTNGMVSATRNGSAVNLPFTANEGDVIVVSVTPNDGYAFEGWADGNTDNPRTITMNADVALSAECSEVVQPPVGNYIQFEDAEVERVLIANGVSSDGVGITIEDAEKVTSIGTWFNGNTAIESFDELDYFTGVTSISSNAFNGCANLQKLVFRYAVPPTLGASAFANTSFPIYVPDASLEAYKTATNWNTYADRIHPLSEIEGDNGVIKYDGLVGAYTFKGRSNEDADYDLVQDRSGNGNIMTIYWGNFGQKHPYEPLLGNGYWDDMLWMYDYSYGKIILPTGLTQFTVIAKRFQYNSYAGGTWAPQVGTGEIAGKGLFWLEYNDGSGKDISNVNGKEFSVDTPESEIVWMNNTYYNGHLLVGTEGDNIHDGRIYLNKFRGDTNSVGFLRMTCLYIFNRELAPTEIESFIKAHIDADYVLPTIEQ